MLRLMVRPRIGVQWGMAMALLFAVGSAQGHAEEMGKPDGDLLQLDESSQKALGADVVYVRLLKEDGTVESRAGRGLESERISYPSDGPLQLHYDTNGSEIVISGRLSKEALGASADAPITLVIPSVLVRIGNASCYKDCFVPQGTSSCSCVCSVAGETC
jgi:hypothetical protein